jgi:SOS-response transcriptional repressor LexA
MSLGSIIRGRREELGLTQEIVAAKVDISKPYLSNIETGKTKNPPSDGVLRALERSMSFRPGKLMEIAHLERTPRDIREQYEMFAAELDRLRGIIRTLGGPQSPDSPAGDGSDDLPVPRGGRDDLTAGVVVPVINKVAAGYPHHFTDLDYPAGVADEYIRCPDVHDSQAFAAHVVGDSMEPDYREGDLVVFSPNAQPRNGDDCFVRLEEGEGTTFKRIYMDAEGTIRLQPLNRTYPAQTYPREKVTGVWPALWRIQRIRQA